MDRFRFRTWYPGIKKMEYFDHKQYINFFQKKVIEDINNSGFEKYCLGAFNHENLMQCTGLKDTKGRLIFEGDILKVTCDSINLFDEHSLAKVKWCDDVSYPAFDLDFFKGNENFDCNAFSHIFESGDYSIEVIGNIYENEV